MRITDAPFSPQEAGLIRRILETPGAPLQCPRCSVDITEDEAIGIEGSVAVRIRLIRCALCRRMMMMTVTG